MLIDLEYLNRHFCYSEDSPSKLIRVVKTTASSKLGEVGSKDNNGYWQVRFKGKVVKIHILIWCIFYGNLEKGMVIDHIDRDKSNNSLKNLRCVPYFLNSHNCNVSSANISGFRGISWDNKNNKWRVIKHVKGIKYDLGRFTDLSLASRALEDFMKINLLVAH